MKKYLIIGLALLQIFLLAACGGKENVVEPVGEVAGEETGVLALPNREDVVSVIISCDDELELIKDEAQIDELFEALSTEKKKVGESRGDRPRAESFLRIDFKLASGKYSEDRVYAFAKEEVGEDGVSSDKEWYAEQPGLGVFLLDDEAGTVVYCAFYCPPDEPMPDFPIEGQESKVYEIEVDDDPVPPDGMVYVHTLNPSLVVRERMTVHEPREEDEISGYIEDHVLEISGEYEMTQRDGTVVCADVYDFKNFGLHSAVKVKITEELAKRAGLETTEITIMKAPMLVR